jgi:hypothetical protein
MIHSIRIRAWHVLAAFAASAVLVASFLAFGAAQSSGTPVNAGVPLAAPYSEPIPAYASYQGWGQVANGGGYYGAATLRSVPVVAWYWNGSGWVQRSRYVGQRVYIYPYAQGWSWTWSEGSGWLAMRTSQLTIGYRPTVIAT